MRSILFSTLLVMHTLANSQSTDDFKWKDEKESHMQFQIGLNATNFLKTFVVPNSSGAYQNPYTVTAKVLHKFRPNCFMGLRTGLGYTDNHSYEKRDINQDESSNTETKLDFRIGLEAQTLFSKRWAMYYGIDYVWNKDVRNYQYGYSSPTYNYMNRSNMTTTSSGFGPVLGVQFRLNKYICLGTELTAYFTTSTGTGNGATYNNSSGYSEFKSESNGRNTQIIAPAFVNCNIVF